MNKLNGKIIEYWPILIGLFIISSIDLYYVITNDGLQIFHYDTMEQALRFLQRGWDLVHIDGFVMWDWNHFFGASIFHHGFYFITSPFWLIYTLFPKESIPFNFLHVNLLKQFLVFCTSYYYIYKLTNNKLSGLASASIISFGGFALGYYNYAHYTDTLIIVPLILHNVEVYLKDNKKFLGLVIFVSIMFVFNANLSIFFSAYIFLYTLFRYVVLNKNINFKQLLIDAGRFLLFYLLGILISSFALIPNLLVLFGSPRISAGFTGFKIINFYDLFRYITGFLQPVVDRNDFNPLITIDFAKSYGHSGGAAVYSLVITLFLFVQSFFILDSNRHKYGVILFYGFLSLLTLFPQVYVLLQGTQDTRWMVMFILFNAYIVGMVLNNIENVNKLVGYIWTAFLVVLMYITYYISYNYHFQLEQIYFIIAKRNYIIIYGILFLYLIIFFWLKNKKLRNVSLVFVIVFESYFSIYNIFFNPLSSIAIDSDEYASYTITDTSIIDTIKDYDDSVYRIDAIDNYAYNNPMGKNYLGFTMYSSVYNYDMDAFMKKHISSGGGWVVGSNPGKWIYKNLFGSKYWFNTTLNYRYYSPYGFEPLDMVMYGTLPVYIFENQYPIPFMYVQANELSLDTWLSLNGYEKDKSLMNYVVTEDSTNTNISFINKDVEKTLGTFGESLTYDFDELQSDAVITVEFPRSEEFKIKVYYDDYVVAEYYSYEPQYSSIYIPQEFNHVEIYVTNLYGIDSIEFINSAYIDYPSKYYSDWYNTLSTGFSNDFEIGNDSFSGTLNVSDDNSWVVTSIAYDSNWNVYVDGSKVDIEKVNAGFIGFKVDQGTHQIEAKYVNKGFIASIFVSVFGIGLLYILNRKSKK